MRVHEFLETKAGQEVRPRLNPESPKISNTGCPCRSVERPEHMAEGASINCTVSHSFLLSSESHDIQVTSVRDNYHFRPAQSLLVPHVQTLDCPEKCGRGVSTRGRKAHRGISRTAHPFRPLWLRAVHATCLASRSIPPKRRSEFDSVVGPQHIGGVLSVRQQKTGRDAWMATHHVGLARSYRADP